MSETKLEEPFHEMYELGEDETDYYMPLTQEERNELKFALNLAIIRASNEADDESLKIFNRMYKRVKYDGLLVDK